MKQSITYMIAVTLAFAAVAAPVAAQQRQPDDRRPQRQLEAAEEAMRALQEAIDELRESRSAEAGVQLEEAMRALRRAQGQMGLSGFSFLADGPRGFSVLATRPRMGVEVKSGSDVESDASGAEILRVTPDSPAEEAGLEAGDIITSVNGESLARTARRGREPGSKLIEIIRELEEGDTVRVQYERDGQKRNASIVLRELDNSFAYSFFTRDGGRALDVRVPGLDVLPEIAMAPRVFTRLYEVGWLNMELVTLNDELGAYFGATKGLLVLKGPEDDALDLRAGDVILAIDGREPTSPSHAMRIIRSYDEGESVQIEIMRRQKRMTVSGVVPERDNDMLIRELRERRER